MKTYLTILCLVCLCMPIQAQPKENRVEALRVAYLTKRLSLSSEEAKVFWPVYEQYKKELAELRQKYSGVLKAEPEALAGKSDAESEKMLSEFLSYKQLQVDLYKKYTSEFNRVISKRKVLLLYKAEEDFKKELLKKIQSREARIPPPPGE